MRCATPARSSLVGIFAAAAVASTPDVSLAASDKQKAWSTTVAPTPHLVSSRAKPAVDDRSRLVSLASAPFPYAGALPGSGSPFLNVSVDGRVGHKTAGGNIHWQDESFSDSRVLLHIPRGFDVRKPSLMVLFFHGHRATLERDVMRRQRVADQISESGVNAVLVAPQLAYDTADSSAGKLWEPGGCKRMLDDAATQLAGLLGSPRAGRTFATMPVVIVGYSGGYLPAAACLQQGRLGERVRGIALLDGLYGEMGTFKSWLTADRSGFFVSSYTGSTRSNNLALRQALTDDTLPAATEMPPSLARGSIAFLAAEGTHRDFVTTAWVDHPIADLLRRARGFAR